MGNFYEYNFVKGDHNMNYSFVSTSDERAKGLLRNLTERELNEGVEPKKLLGLLNKFFSSNENITGYKVERQLDSLCKPRWIISIHRGKKAP